MKILVTGANGQLGRALQKVLINEEIELLLTDTKEMDITDANSVKKVFNKFEPEIVINCAAFTNVDKCETEEELAFKINAEGPRNLVKMCLEYDACLVHISTDYVFDGEKSEPYAEEDIPNPQSVYGKSKLLAEQIILENMSKYFIIRTAWMFGDGENFVRKVVQNAKNKNEVTVVDDQFGSPTSSMELAKVINLLISSNKYGIYHASCEGYCNWAQFAEQIFEELNLNVKVKHVKSNEYVSKVKRPKNSILTNKKLLENFNYKMKDWQNALKDYISGGYVMSGLTKKVLVTGANGYLGRHVVKELLNRGYEVLAADFRYDGVDERAIRVEEPIFSGKENIYELMGKPDVCIHLAWRNGFVHNDDSHILDLPSHYTFIKNMIAGGLKSISIMGTMHEVGYWEGAVDEHTPTNPISLYGIAKDALRNITFNLTMNKDVSVHWLRAYYIMGDDLKNNSIFSKLVQAEQEGKEKFPFTSGKNKYDFITVQELAKQIVAASVQDQITGIINVCTGEPISLADKVESFIKENDFKIKLEYGAYPDRPYDSDAIWGDATKIRKILENEK